MSIKSLFNVNDVLKECCNLNINCCESNYIVHSSSLEGAISQINIYTTHLKTYDVVQFYSCWLSFSCRYILIKKDCCVNISVRWDSLNLIYNGIFVSVTSLLPCTSI